MKIGNNTLLPKTFITWPHQVKLGDNCRLEKFIHFKYDGIWTPGPNIIIKNNVFIGSSCEFNIKESITIGDDCLIASGCRFIDHDHGLLVANLMRQQLCTSMSISVGCDVWLGVNVIVLKGVQINDGVIVAAGAVVTKSIPRNEIWAGIPARKIGERK